MAPSQIQKFIRVSSCIENIVDTGLGWLNPNLARVQRVELWLSVLETDVLP